MAKMLSILRVIEYTLLLGALFVPPAEVSHRITCPHPLHHRHFVAIALGNGSISHHELFV